jgi:hypothetical protein
MLRTTMGRPSAVVTATSLKGRRFIPKDNAKFGTGLGVFENLPGYVLTSSNYTSKIMRRMKLDHVTGSGLSRCSTEA